MGKRELSSILSTVVLVYSHVKGSLRLSPFVVIKAQTLEQLTSVQVRVATSQRVFLALSPLPWPLIQWQYFHPALQTVENL